MIKEKKEYISAPDGLIRAVWKNLPKEELLQRLKNELERLDMLESPSRTELHKRYDNHNIPSPNTYLNLFECTWAELMTMIGINYNGIQAIKNGASAKNKGKRHAVKWADMECEDLLDIVLEEMHEKKIRTTAEYTELRDKNKSPSLPIFTNKLGGWNNVKDEYEKKYGTRIDGQFATSTRGRKKGSSNDGWNYSKLGKKTDEDLLKSTLKEIHEKGFNTKEEYAEGRDRRKAPSLPILNKRLGGWDEVKKKCEEVYGAQEQCGSQER